MSDEKKLIVTKENLINSISNRAKDDYISISDLIELIDYIIEENGAISKRKLYKSIKASHTKSVVKDIYNSLEEIIFESLSSVNEEHDVHLKLFEGITLDGLYIPENMKRNNFTGEMSLVESKIKPKFNFTRSYCEKLNK